MALRAPTTERFLDELPSRRFQQMWDDETGEATDHQTSGQTAIEVGQTFVRVYGDLRTGRPEMRVEFSAPFVLHNHNPDPLPLHDVADVVDAVRTELRRNLVDVPPLDDCRVIRLDVARDFDGVPSIERTLLGISRLPVARARHGDELRRGQSGRWQSLKRGVGRWVVCGYDKAEQLRQLADREHYRREPLLRLADEHPDRLRWELELRHDLLREQGLQSVADIDSPAVNALAVGYFERSRFGDLVSGSNRLHDIVQSLQDEGRTSTARGLLTVLAAGLLDVDIPYSPNKSNDYRVLARALELTPADLVTEGEPRRLDFESGTELRGDLALRDTRPPVSPRRPEREWPSYGRCALSMIPVRKQATLPTRVESARRAGCPQICNARRVAPGSDTEPRLRYLSSCCRCGVTHQPGRILYVLPERALKKQKERGSRPSPLRSGAGRVTHPGC